MRRRTPVLPDPVPGARNFREAGGHAADLPQDVLARLGGRPHPLLGLIVAPSETRIRTLVQAIGAGLLDEVIGGWLRGLADAGRLDGLLTAIAIGGKRLRGVLDGQVKLFAAMLRQEKVIFGQLKALLRTVDLQGAVVAADALCRQWTRRWARRPGLASRRRGRPLPQASGCPGSPGSASPAPLQWTPP